MATVSQGNIRRYVKYIGCGMLFDKVYWDNEKSIRFRIRKIWVQNASLFCLINNYLYHTMCQVFFYMHYKYYLIVLIHLITITTS